MLSSVNIYMLDPCLLADEHIACSACVGRSAPPQATHTHACPCPSASHPQQLLVSCPAYVSVFPTQHSRGHLNSHQSATPVFHQGHVHPPRSPSDTIGWITRILDTNGYAAEDWQSQSSRLMLSRRAMAACIHRCIEHHYTLTSSTLRSRLQG